eukprot:GHVU01010717.1.p1 GENE.GHVU01010717.1~~GHVU01010717.1.p1  ORF type:complete len:383 (+),score=53.19 GHVU01010717.1:1410-2558(+)
MMTVKGVMISFGGLLLAVAMSPTIVVSRVSAPDCGDMVAPSEGYPGKTGLERLISKEIFDSMFKFRMYGGCDGSGYFTFANFLRASQAYPKFANTGDDESALTRDRRELAAFLAQTSTATMGGGEAPSAYPCGVSQAGYCFTQEDVADDAQLYCEGGNPCRDDGFDCSCRAGKSYHGRGPMQLSWNANYGRFGVHKFGDSMLVVNRPELLIGNPVLGWEAALWVWTTANAPWPSCSEAMQGTSWQPSEEQDAAGWYPGFAMTTNILAGALECGAGAEAAAHPQAAARSAFFKRYMHMLGAASEAITPADEAERCSCMRHYLMGLDSPLPGCLDAAEQAAEGSNQGGSREALESTTTPVLPRLLLLPECTAAAAQRPTQVGWT